MKGQKKTKTTQAVQQEQPKAAVQPKQQKQAQQPSLDAVRCYVLNPRINSELLAGNELTSEQQAIVAGMDAAMQVLPDTELNCVTINDTLQAYMQQAGVSEVRELEGKELVNSCFMSASKLSLHDKLAKRYALGLEKPVCIVVHTQGKAKGVDVNELLKEQSVYPHQQEVVLARNQSFLVKKVRFGSGWLNETYPILHLYAI